MIPNPYFAGHYPPPLQTWVDKGWEIVSQYEKPAAESNTDSD